MALKPIRLAQVALKELEMITKTDSGQVIDLIDLLGDWGVYKGDYNIRESGRSREAFEDLGNKMHEGISPEAVKIKLERARCCMKRGRQRIGLRLASCESRRYPPPKKHFAKFKHCSPKQRAAVNICSSAL